MRSWRLALCCLVLSTPLLANEYIVRLRANNLSAFAQQFGGKVEWVDESQQLVKWTTEQALQTTSRVGMLEVAKQKNYANLELAKRALDQVDSIQPNFVYHLFPNPQLAANRKQAIAAANSLSPMFFGNPYPDNPEIKDAPKEGTGADPLLKNAWGIKDSNADAAWKTLEQGNDIVIAVTDTGVDYTHEDLAANMWHNPGEIPNDKKDNDGNGYVDDIVGWDFANNDNKPYDYITGLITTLFIGGNPGHGTHVAGVIGARLNNGKGIAGVAPKVKIMALRFISERGQGDTAAAVKAVNYAVDNGAKIINASWGSEKGQEDDTALIKALERARDKGVIFVAAAGNGRSNADGSHGGFDNDNDPKPAVPASFNIDNIISVAAIDSKGELGSFSNYGAKTVHIGAPGVKILSTVPGSRYEDAVIDFPPFLTATWDGTSMATPHVVGALAAIWSKDPKADWKKVRDTLLKNAKPIPSLKGKVSTDGKLDLQGL